MIFLSQQHICEVIGSVHDPMTEYIEGEVLDIFNNNNLKKYVETTDPKLMTWIATYYEHIEHNENKFVEFLNKSINFADQNAMNNLGCYYFEKYNFKKAKELWTMSEKSENNLKILEMLEQKLKID